MRTFVPYDDGTSVLAAYTCTPVVHFSLADLRAGEQAKGRTVAELGAMNTPIDMVSYRRARRGVPAGVERPASADEARPADIDAQERLTEPNEPRGVPREELPQHGVTHLAAADGQS